MIILLFFALLAGIVTALSPCILPVLPLLLSAGIGQTKYRPLGIIIGLIVSFTLFTLTLTTIVQKTGISPDVLRYLAIGFIIFSGLIMIFPGLEKLYTRLASPLTRLGNRIENSANQTNTGFSSGLIIGIALGLIWAPCAGPILATISALVAIQTVTWQTVLITLAYSIGTALPMLLIMYGASRISSSISALTPYTELIRKLFGVLMILAALAIAFHIDVLFQQIAVKYFPMLTIEDNERVKKELETLQNNTHTSNPVVGGQAPDFIGIIDWINAKPLTLEQLKGKVVLVDFWTYSCINCVRTLPYLKKWYSEYKDKGFVLVGVHTPEFEFEKSFDNVQDAVKRFGIEYPVARDNNFSTWRNYNNRYWPAHYLIDQQGIIRYIHFGEGHYTDTENAIRSLLGLAPIGAPGEKVERVGQQTPETYLGYKRAQQYTSGISLIPEKTSTYDYAHALAPDEVGLKGNWFIASEYITTKSNNAELNLNFIGTHVYLVMAAEKPAYITVLIDGKTVSREYYSKDMDAEGKILVKESRMYAILDLKNNAGRHMLTLRIPEGISLYAFTFGNGTE
jgi:cytochrome c biogenesis protein CcdA/thiol-disulfide isomerase/thioredoxin